MNFLRQLFTSKRSFALLKQPNKVFWLSLSLITPLYFGLISLHYVSSQNYIVQDDARQHVVWLQRFVDPQLFPEDLIANYFETIAPIGYKFLYWAIAQVGIAPIALAKLLPILLSLIATVYLFKVSLLIFPISISAFITTLIFNQHLWLNDDLVSSTPRAFVYPLFAAFLYYLLKRSLVPCLISIALQGLFFPQIMLVAVAILTLRLFPGWGGSKQDYSLWLAGMFVAMFALLPFALHLSEFGPAITVAQMKVTPEYGWRGRSEYFGVNPLSFILNGSSGLRIPVFPSIILAGFGLPFLLKSRSPLVKLITAEVKILAQILLGSLGLFFLAHLLLLKLHFPSRYMYHSWRFVLSISAGIVLTLLLDSGRRWLQRKANTQLRLRESLCIALVGLFAATVIVVPAVPYLFFKFQGWVVGEAPELYEYLAKQPKQTLVASLSDEANNLPAFSQRSTLVGREFALAHHPNYYRQIKQRVVDVVQAQYSPDLTVTQRVITQYGIDFFLVDRAAFNSSYLLNQDWLIYSSFQAVVMEAVNQLNQGKTPALVGLVDRCSVLSTKNLILLKAACIAEAQVK
jgi:hypothetical protein